MSRQLSSPEFVSPIAVRTATLRAQAARLCSETARLHAELADVLDHSRALRWQTLAACVRIRPIRGGSDHAAILVTIITGASVCLDCLSTKSGIPRAEVESILTGVAATISIATDTGCCDACREVKPTHRLDVVGPPANGASRPRSTQRAILGFLEGHAGSAFCASCISAQVVGGKDIDVAMRHLEGSGMLRRHGRCSGCGRLRLVGTLPALN